MSESNKVFKRKLKGIVVSNKGEKTAVVRVERRFKHPMYSKYVIQAKKYHAHDEENRAQVGETVTIVESRPHSKMKKWELV